MAACSRLRPADWAPALGLLTLNRGEGGQNVMAMDLYDALGLTRTEELLTADRYMGVDQYFTRVVDYGFSKTREEALEKWGHDRVLADAVRVVRMMRPLVVTSVFVGAATDGHGHHQLAGRDRAGSVGRGGRSRIDSRNRFAKACGPGRP